MGKTLMEATIIITRRQRVTKESAIGKLFASGAAAPAAEQALQIHGGCGFIEDYPIGRVYRAVKLNTIGGRASEIQRLVIARQFLNS
jgi:alkylation response protein AidB-like acyl-CoA dehydrogenase